MEIEYYGGNCLKITTKKAVLVIDDNLKQLGQKNIVKDDYIVLFSAPHDQVEAKVRLLIDVPGDYEVAEASIQGIAARAYKDEPTEQDAIIYKITVGDTRLLAVGHIYPELSDEQIEAIGAVDLMVVPVGNNDLTLSGDEALKLWFFLD